MLKRLFLAATILFAASTAYAQSTWPTPQTATGGPTVTGGVGLCLNGSNQAVPCSAATPTYVTGTVTATTPSGTTPVSAQVSCGTGATLVLAASTAYVVRTISNQSGQTVYFGPSGVTTSTGLPVPTGGGYDASHEQGALYCVAASAATVGTLQY